MPQPLRAGIRERLARSCTNTRQRSPPRVGEHLLELLLRRALRVVAGARAPALAPRRAEQLLNLPAIGEAVFHVPDRAAIAWHELDVSGNASHQASRPSSRNAGAR